MKKYVNLEVPSVLGMGAVGPTLSLLTATIFAAFAGPFHLDSAAYPVIMLILSSLMAVFPTMQSTYAWWLKMVMYPIVTVVIFAAAWGSSSGLSAGEEALKSPEQKVALSVEEPIKGAMAPVSVSEMKPEVFPGYKHHVPLLKTNDAINVFHGGFFKRAW